MPVLSLPPIRELDSSDVKSVLARNRVGRLAFVRGAEIDVLPLHYVFSGRSIFGRTASGGKLDQMDVEGTTVAFQVDEIQSTHHWRSVLVHGLFQVISRRGEQEEWLRGLGLLRRLAPDTLRDDDPVPGRTQIFRILVRQATGRGMG